MDFISPNFSINFNEAGNSDGAATPKASATKLAAFQTSDVFVHDLDSPFYIFHGTYKDASGSAPVPASQRGRLLQEPAERALGRRSPRVLRILRGSLET